MTQESRWSAKEAASHIRVAVVHDSGWGGDDKPYSVRETSGFQRIFTRGFQTFALARRWAIDGGFALCSEEFFVWFDLDDRPTEAR